jgi:hypothetical protein
MGRMLPERKHFGAMHTGVFGLDEFPTLMGGKSSGVKWKCLVFPVAISSKWQVKVSC